MTEDASVVFSEADIAQAVRRLAASIAADSQGAPLLLVAVLKGAAVLAADLVRALPASLDPRLDYIAVGSYGDSERSTGTVCLRRDITGSVEGKHVVIVEDIVETGLTLQFLKRLLGGRGPASLRSCALLDKPSRRLVDVSPDYVGLSAPDAFIVGYGLDYQERYRNLPYLAKLRVRALDG